MDSKKDEFDHAALISALIKSQEKDKPRSPRIKTVDTSAIEKRDDEELELLKRDAIKIGVNQLFALRW